MSKTQENMSVTSRKRQKFRGRFKSIKFRRLEPSNQPHLSRSPILRRSISQNPPRGWKSLRPNARFYAKPDKNHAIWNTWEDLRPDMARIVAHRDKNRFRRKDPAAAAIPPLDAIKGAQEIESDQESISESESSSNRESIKKNVRVHEIK